MTRVRTFYGHEGVVYPTGLVPADATPDDEVLEGEVEQIDMPDNSWKVPAIDKFAEDYGITFEEGDKKPEKLAAIQKWAAELPEGDLSNLSAQEG